VKLEVLVADMKFKKVNQSLHRPITRPDGHQKVKAPIFQDSRHLDMVRLSALCSGCPYRPGIIPGKPFISVKILSEAQDHSAAGKITQMKNFSDTIGIRNFKIPVPQPTAQQHSWLRHCNRLIPILIQLTFL